MALKSLTNAYYQRMPGATDGPIDSIVYMILFIQRETQARSGSRQELIRTKLIPAPGNSTDTSKAHDTEPAFHFLTKLRLRSKHSPVLKLAPGVPSQVVVNSKQTEIVEWHTLVGRTDHSTISKHLFLA